MEKNNLFNANFTTLKQQTEEDWSKDFFSPAYVASFYSKKELTVGVPEWTVGCIRTGMMNFNSKLCYVQNDSTEMDKINTVEDNSLGKPDKKKSAQQVFDTCIEKELNILDNQADPQGKCSDDLISTSRLDKIELDVYGHLDFKENEPESPVDTVSVSYSFESSSSSVDYDYVQTIYSQEDSGDNKFLPPPYQAVEDLLFRKSEYMYGDVPLDSDQEMDTYSDSTSEVYYQISENWTSNHPDLFPGWNGLTKHDSQSSESLCLCCEDVCVSANDSVSSVPTPGTQTSTNSSTYVCENGVFKYIEHQKSSGQENLQNEMILRLPWNNFNSKESCEKLLNYMKKIFMIISENSMVNITKDSDVLLKNIFINNNQSCKISVGIVDHGASDFHLADSHICSDFQTQTQNIEENVLPSSREEYDNMEKNINSLSCQPEQGAERKLPSLKVSRLRKWHRHEKGDESANENQKKKDVECSKSESDSFIKRVWSKLVPGNHETSSDNVPASKKYYTDQAVKAVETGASNYNSSEKINIYQDNNDLKEPIRCPDCSSCPCCKNQPNKNLAENSEDIRSFPGGSNLVGQQKDKVCRQQDPRNENYGYGLSNPFWLKPSAPYTEMTKWMYPHPYKYDYLPKHLPTSSTYTSVSSHVASPLSLPASGKEAKKSAQVESSRIPESFKTDWPTVKNRKRSFQKYFPKCIDFPESKETCYTESTESSSMKSFGCIPKLYASPSTSSAYEWKEKYKKKYSGYFVPYIDSHCHLDILFKREGFVGSFVQYIQKHKDTIPANFIGCIAVFCHPLSFSPRGGLWMKLAAELGASVYIAMGCHPKNASYFDSVAYRSLKECMQHSKIVALGEIGLDYSGTFHQHKEQQKVVFIQQLKLAVQLNKPLVIHCRDAEDDCLEIMERMVPRNYRIHCHCFTGNYASCQRWLNTFPNLFVGLTPVITYNSARPAQEVAACIPLDRLLLETDAPYFVPLEVPRSYQPLSHPGMAIAVAIKVAYLKDVSVQSVLQHCLKNTKIMYGIDAFTSDVSTSM